MRTFRRLRVGGGDGGVAAGWYLLAEQAILPSSFASRGGSQRLAFSTVRRAMMPSTVQPHRRAEQATRNRVVFRVPSVSTSPTTAGRTGDGTGLSVAA